MHIRRIGALALAALTLAACTTTATKAPPAAGPVVVTPTPCADFTVALYFEAGSAQLTPEAAAVIKTAALRAKGCRVRGVDVVGLADAPGDPQANLALSKKRAATVIATLSRQGFASVEIQTAAAGDVGAQTAAGQARPLRRRTDVTFHAKPQ